MWFEPAEFPDWLPIGNGLVSPVGFQTPPGGEIGSNTHVLNDHTYCCSLGLSVCAEGEPSTDMQAKCRSFHNKRITTRDKDAKRLGVPYVITEFGACLTEGPCTQEIQQVADIADEFLVGWAYWQFKFFEDLTTTASVGAEGFYNYDGSLQQWKVKALARTYLQNTQGQLTKLNFNTVTGTFNGEFIVNTEIAAPTVLYASKKYWYPHGKQVNLHVDGEKLTEDQVQVDDSDKNYYKFQITDASLNGKTIKVHVLAL